MSERKSKFDERIYYCAKTDRIVRMCADYKVDGVQQWFHHDGKRVWWTKGKFSVPTWFTLLDRLPEGAFYVR